MRMLTTVGCVIGVLLVGCITTPAVMLKNEATGQIARCGGTTTNTFATGYVEHLAQESDAERCIKAYEAQGFHPLK